MQHLPQGGLSQEQVAVGHCLPIIWFYHAVDDIARIVVFFRWDAVMDLPEGGLPQEEVGVGHWQPGISFGQFAERTVAGFYHAKN